jgi:hypothetical protein
LEMEFLDSLPLFMKGKTLETPFLSVTGEQKDITKRAIGALWWELIFTLANGILWMVFAKSALALTSALVA